MQHISYVLQDEHENLLSKKNELEKQYKEQSKRKRDACEQGAETWHDNADYEDAEYQQNLLGKRISDLAGVIQNTKILVIEGISNHQIHIGSRIQILIDNQEFEYKIGGYPTIQGRISYKSPLGKALVGKKIGDSFMRQHENKKKNIIILSIT